MIEYSDYEDVPLPVEQVWDVIGSFGNLPIGGMLQAIEVGKDAEGEYRMLTLEGYGEVKEPLVVSSQYSYTYTVTEGFDITGYRSTLAVIPIDVSHSRIELIIRVVARGQETPEETIAFFRDQLRRELDEFKVRLGLTVGRPTGPS